MNTGPLALTLLLAGPCAAARPRRALVIALDGLDWSVVRPLAEQGRLPYLSRLAAEGSTSTMRVPPPLRSPAIWTTVATGVPPTEHGIDDFSVDGRRVSSADRRAEAAWESVSAASMTVAVVGWLATWPAEAVRGWIINDEALNPEILNGGAYPADFPVEAAWDHLGAESAKRLRRFLPFRWDPGYARRWPADAPEYRRHDLVERRLAWVYMRDESLTRIMETLLRRRPNLAMIHLWGADHVSHAFWRAAFGAADQAERRDFGGIIAAYYEYLDEALGRLLRAAGPDALIVVLSDHGFQAWTPPPNDPFPFLSGNHSPDAVLILAGPGVHRGARLDDPHVVDIAPTLLRYLHVPPPTGQSGRVLNEAFNPGVLLPARVERAPSRLPRSAAPSALSPSEAERLRALGYLR